MPRPPLNLTSRRFGALLAIKIDHIRSKHGAYWLCECLCGNTVIVRACNLTTNHTKGCGHAAGRIAEHGDTGTRFYKVWSSLKERCLNPNAKAYKYYGAKGVSIHINWLHNYTQFKLDMLDSYNIACKSLGEFNVVLDRIDSKGNYEVGNCRWLSRSENTRLAQLARHSVS